MELIKRTVLSLCLLSAAAAAASQPKVSSGKLDVYEKFQSEYIPARNVYVWTPDGYSQEKKYAVLYMHDGQMLFDADYTWNKQEWGIDEMCGALLQEDRLKDFIVVGIDNVAETRFYDYCPQKILNYVTEADVAAMHVDIGLFGADAYLKFIVNEVKPFVDKHYATASDVSSTFLMGSSMGGLISLYGVCEYPQVFGGAACLSTHTPVLCDFNQPEEVYDLWANALCRYVSDNLPAVNSRRIYMDYGDRTIDAMYGRSQTMLDKVFVGKGWNSSAWITVFYPGAAHTETDWNKRLVNPLQFLLGKSVE